MYRATFWQRLLRLITRTQPSEPLLIRPNPSGIDSGPYHLVAYDIPLSENFGDC